MKHNVRDEGVTGSNPATPTIVSVDKSSHSDPEPQTPGAGAGRGVHYRSIAHWRATPDLDIVAGQIWRARMATGTVKWFNPTKGYGFIQPQGGGRDVFVHISAVERAGLSTLNEGQQIEYEIEENRGKTSAVNLKVK
jgi:CspA family cold shock protein